MSLVRGTTRVFRHFATLSSNIPPEAATSSQSLQVFNRRVKELQRDRAALRNGGLQSRTVDYVRNEVAESLVDRLLDIKRRFNTVLDLGAGAGHFSRLLEAQTTERVTMLDSSYQMLYRDANEDFEVEVTRVHGDEENLLELVGPNTQEAIISCLSLHWINDLPGIMIQVQRALKPDGVFLGAIFGGDTLFELRTALQLAEVERRGGISPRISPMTGIRDVSNLLSRAGFSLLTVDIDEVRVGYPSMWELMDDLHDMGEGNAVLGRRLHIDRDVLVAASSIYKELHGEDGGKLPATFQIIYFVRHTLHRQIKA